MSLIMLWNAITHWPVQWNLYSFSNLKYHCKCVCFRLATNRCWLHRSVAVIRPCNRYYDEESKCTQVDVVGMLGALSARIGTSGRILCRKSLAVETRTAWETEPLPLLNSWFFFLRVRGEWTRRKISVSDEHDISRGNRKDSKWHIGFYDCINRM